MNIIVENATFSYDGEHPVIKNISISLGKEQTAIIGQNGAGKTTFMRLLNNTHQVNSGSITIDGIPVESQPLSSWAKRIGYVFQNPKDQLFHETVYKEIEFGLRKKVHTEAEKKKRVEEIAEFIGLQEFLDHHPLEMAYSRQKLITLASILTTDPELILLDEPTAGQDWKEIEHFETVIRELGMQGKKFITISHDMNFVARNFSRVVVFCNGEILIDGTTKEVFSQSELIRKSFVESPVPVLVSQDLQMDDCPLTLAEFRDSYKRSLK
ncbi:energy-coupling factor ABC transporter ATP-binding protein [Sediminispirochaeta bajacaliforniensis]|uniref:energy-coupling factor ABC transporter ATP-binding protein n=1 Tax=Sediminispirochaeta bajacaliforniensis TaxID=148 RepID=UPI000368345D|nr:ABC transporter ATP-binding protein [Sediminispirochaeta bajacaliforniensis]